MNAERPMETGRTSSRETRQRSDLPAVGSSSPRRGQCYKSAAAMLPKTVLLGLCAALLFAVCPLHVHAQTCAMLPPGSPPDGPPPPDEARRAALEAVTRALSDDGVTVIGTADAQRRMVGETFAECNALECGGEVARSLGVDYVVLVTLWAPRGTPTSVVVTLIGASDSAAGDAPVEGDLTAATLSALTTARQRWQAAQMGFLAVTSTPPGADVEVDGRLVGRTPIRHLAMAGQRTVRIHMDGYAPVERSVRVEPTREHPVEVTLVEGVEEVVEGPVAPVTRTEAHFANWLIGGAHHSFDRGTEIDVRDSKAPAAGTLSFDLAAWGTFVNGIKVDAFRF